MPTKQATALSPITPVWFGPYFTQTSCNRIVTRYVNCSIKGKHIQCDNLGTQIDQNRHFWRPNDDNSLNEASLNTVIFHEANYTILEV